MLKFGLSAVLLVAAAPALAQDGPPPAIQQAAMAFGQCVMNGVQGLAATVTPEAGAASALAACATQRQALQQAAEAYIATMPEADRAGALEQLRSQLGGAEARIADRIRQQRSATPAQ